MLQLIGTNLLWLGWMAFNSSSLYAEGGIEMVVIATRNTLLGGAAGFLGGSTLFSLHLLLG